MQMFKCFHLFNLLFIYIIHNDLMLVLGFFVQIFIHIFFYSYRGAFFKTFSCFLLLLMRDTPKTMGKLRLSTKFPHQEIS